MKPPLLLIGIGTDDNSGTAEFGRFVHRLRCRLEHLAADVCGGFLDRAEPRLRDSVASLVARGAGVRVARAEGVDAGVRRTGSRGGRSPHRSAEREVCSATPAGVTAVEGWVSGKCR